MQTSAAPGMDDVLRSCVLDPDAGICSEDFLRSMTADLHSRNVIRADEHLGKGMIAGRRTIIVRAADGTVRAVPALPVVRSLNP
jgi:hypothetical protein